MCGVCVARLRHLQPSTGGFSDYRLYQGESWNEKLQQLLHCQDQDKRSLSALLAVELSLYTRRTESFVTALTSVVHKEIRELCHCFNFCSTQGQRALSLL